MLASLFRPGFNVAGLRPVAPIPQNRGAARAPPFNPFASVTVGAPLRLNGISLLHPPSAREVWRLLPTWPPPLRLPVGGGGVSLSASVSGDIRAVEWYVWGRQVRVERAHPYTIAGDKRGRVFVWRGGGAGGGRALSPSACGWWASRGAFWSGRGISGFTVEGGDGTGWASWSGGRGVWFPADGA